MHLDTECDVILVPLLRVGVDDMPHSFFDYYTYSIKDKLSQEVRWKMTFLNSQTLKIKFQKWPKMHKILYLENGSKAALGKET